MFLIETTTGYFHGRVYVTYIMEIGGCSFLESSPMTQCDVVAFELPRLLCSLMVYQTTWVGRIVTLVWHYFLYLEWMQIDTHLQKSHIIHCITRSFGFIYYHSLIILKSFECLSKWLYILVLKYIVLFRILATWKPNVFYFNTLKFWVFIIYYLICQN